MNRKNLTAAVLAGLAGAAGIAGTAQAVNLNPDGLGQVLMYPYYTTNGGNQTLLSVVNTTDSAKAVKVRFLEGFNSREVLDFNLYMSAWDVWAAAIVDGGMMDEASAGTPYLLVPDDSCTVPYLYGMGVEDGYGFGWQPFLKLAYNDNGTVNDVNYDFADGGPTGIERAAEGHFEMIEMGTVVSGSDTEDDITHGTFDDPVLDDNGDKQYDENDKLITEKVYRPGDCEQLVDNWTRDANYDPLGDWTLDPQMDIGRNSGGLFGGAAIVNSENGTMYSYNALAVQGFDKSDGLLHFEPGGINPSLNDGDQDTATIFFGVPQDKAVSFQYPSNRTVEAVSALFMHENIMNEYTIEKVASASTEWVVTFPTKNFYVDTPYLIDVVTDDTYWHPDPTNPLCGGWTSGDPYPTTKPISGDPIDGPGPWPNIAYGIDWSSCNYVEENIIVGDQPVWPFTEVFDGKACEEASIQVWDRNERTPGGDTPSGERPPVVSPSIPGACDPDIQVCDEPTPFEFCYEVNVMRFQNTDEEWGGDIFATPDFGDDGSLLLTVENPYENGWARIDFSADSDHVDRAGLVGLPVTGFAAYEFESNYVEGGSVKAYYGGLFNHRGNVRRICDDQRGCGSFVSVD
ncbi:MAG: hypothetical protein PVJ33_07185 [Lysobacterales bacterium]|jgi:hypothetical protein